MTDDRELEARMRAGMAAETRPVVADDRFAEQIIATALLEPPAPERPHWQNWVVPAMAAALVALLVGSVLVGTSLLHSSRSGPAHQGQSFPPSTVAPTHAPSRPSSPHPSATTGPSQSRNSAPSRPGPAGGPVPAGFSAYDLTWISNDQGWGLGTAPCQDAPCTSIVRTTDGGQSWVGIPAPRAFLSPVDTCTSECAQVTGIRFASPLVGYVFGPDSLWMTTDGGATWQQQGGGAWSLEIVAGQVLRISATPGHCAPGCTFGLQRAAVGDTSWQTVALPSGGQDVRATLAASGQTVVLATYGNPAGGASNEQSVLFASTDAGGTWRRIGEPCPQGSGPVGEVDSVAVSVAADGSISTLCVPRGQQGSAVVLTSTNGGTSFGRAATVPDRSARVLAAASAGDVVVGGQATYLNSSRVSGPGAPRFVGFESESTGRLVDPSGVWVTQDGGRSWIHQPF